MLILESIKIDRGYAYSHLKGQVQPLKGEVVFKGTDNKIQIELSEELSTRIIAICAEEIVSAARAAAEVMTSDLIDNQPAVKEIEND